MASGDPGRPALPEAGDVLDAKYALVRVLGQGGMGVVFEAEHLRLKQKCAIKMLVPAMLALADIVSRFEREARASAQLRGPHVARVMDVETTSEGLTYIVMELLVGRDLDGELAERGRLPYAEAVDYVLQACSAIVEAHAAGIIHRDLKPGNLFLARVEEELVVKVLDFGISKVAGDENATLTGAGTLIGTALYMSPEQLRSAAKVDARSDIWSLGIILYELVAGEAPWTGTAPQVAAQIVTEDAPDLMTKCELPPPLAAIVAKILTREPAERFQSVSELAAALMPFAPQASIGRTVAEQIARRSMSRKNAGDAPSDPRPATDMTQREETSAGVTTNAGAPRTSGSRIAFVAVAVLLALAGMTVAGLAIVRPRSGAGAPAASASPTESATGEASARRVSAAPAAASASVAAPVVVASASASAAPHASPRTPRTATAPPALQPAAPPPASRPTPSAPPPKASGENPQFLP